MIFEGRFLVDIMAGTVILNAVFEVENHGDGRPVFFKAKERRISTAFSNHRIFTNTYL